LPQVIKADGKALPGFDFGNFPKRRRVERRGLFRQETIMPQDTDATHILAADHRSVEALFEEFEKASGADRKAKIAEQICTELKIHAQIEEEVFYPALKGKVDDDLLKEAYVEHDGAKVLINDILASGPTDEYFEAKVTVLSEEIKHHVKEEEKQHDNMFQQARAAEVDLDALGEQLLARKEELKRQAETAGLPPAALVTM
jgi:hemerythrin superfamily protein